MSRTIAELEASFVKLGPDGSWRMGATMAEADGLWLLCPRCFETNGGLVGTHGHLLWKPHVPQTVYPTPGRWDHRGTGLHDLTLVASSSSILTVGGCRAHFYIESGRIRMT